MRDKKRKEGAAPKLLTNQSGGKKIAGEKKKTKSGHPKSKGKGSEGRLSHKKRWKKQKGATKPMAGRIQNNDDDNA